MNKEETKEALENIQLIKELVTETQREMSYSGGGWISIIWGIFCIVGFWGVILLKVRGPLAGIWWTGLGAAASLATYLVIKSRTKTQPKRRKHSLVRYHFYFWLPLIFLAYVLAGFCIFSPDIPKKYIPIFILLVISTGYLIIGFLLRKEILFMGSLGFLGTVITAIFFMKYAYIILSFLFGLGLIVTGVVANWRFKKEWKSI